MNRKLTILLVIVFAVIVTFTIVILHRERTQHRTTPSQEQTAIQQTNGTLKLDTSAPQFPE